MKAQPEWPVAFFDDDYLRIYRPMFTEETTRREVDFIESALALPPGASVLDLACGIGRHAVGMALRGYRITGLEDRKSTRLNSSHVAISYAVFCLKKKNQLE